MRERGLKGNVGGKGPLQSRLQQLDENMDIKRHVGGKSAKRRSQWAITKESKCVFFGSQLGVTLDFFQSPCVQYCIALLASSGKPYMATHGTLSARYPPHVRHGVPSYQG